MRDYQKIFLSLTTLCYAFFIFSYPPSFYNDDSLFLVNGIEYYSIIDFSPHFPGYPALIILGKILNFFLNDSKLSLFILTALSAVLTPMVIFFLVEKIVNKKAALIAFLLTISSNYLLNLSLTMLSDSVGIFFFFLALYLLEINKNKMAGLLFSVALFTRPSYIILFVVGFIYLLIRKKDSLKHILIYFFLGLIFFLGFIVMQEGQLYFIEAKRFIFGHFSIWGTGQNSKITWLSNLFSFINLPYLLLVFCFFKPPAHLRLYCSFFLVYLVWILLAQNPDNIRHMIPLIIMGNILLSQFLSKYNTTYTYLIVIFNLFFFNNLSVKTSPIEHILSDIKKENSTIITNRGVEFFRKFQDNPVVDNYYAHSSKFIKMQGNTYTISASKLQRKPFQTYKGRFVGEPSYYLYK